MVSHVSVITSEIILESKSLEKMNIYIRKLQFAVAASSDALG